MLKTIRDFEVKGKRVLVRVDFNVPLNEKGAILDDFRLVQTLPTIEYLLGKGAKVILISHLGRPNPESEIRNPKKICRPPCFAMRSGQANPNDQIPIKSRLIAKQLQGAERLVLIPNSKQKLSLRPVAQRLEKLLKRKIIFLSDCIGDRVRREIKKMKAGEAVVLENLRFYRGEEENDPKFAKQLACLGEIFIQDAFAACHRQHASIVGLPKLLPAGIGLLLEKELGCLTRLSNNSQRPLVVIIGGAKVQTKIKLINKFSKIADWVLVGHLIKKEIDREQASAKYERIIEPIDGLKEKGEYFDIGPKTIKLFSEKISRAETVFWNGPLGKIEEKNFTQGSLAIAKAIIKSDAYSVVGGGETIAFLREYNLRSKFNFVSTGGGAMLAFLSGEKLPGIEAIKS